MAVQKALWYVCDQPELSDIHSTAAQLLLSDACLPILIPTHRNLQSTKIGNTNLSDAKTLPELGLSCWAQWKRLQALTTPGPGKR